VKESVFPYQNIAGTGSAENPRGSRGRGGVWRRLLSAMPVLAVVALLSGCRLEMYDQPRQEPLEASSVFADTQSARQPVVGTVPRTQPFTGSINYYGESSGGVIPAFDTAAVARANDPSFEEFDRSGNIPVPVTREFLIRGQERYNIYCSPCHGRLGDGQGMIVHRGFPVPPTFHQDRLRQVADGHYYDVITNGFGVMFSYASRVAPDDRWAITAYIRALQLSQSASLQDVPSQERIKLQGSGE